MDYNKIGSFIMNERKAKKLTQAKLAEKVFVSEKTISKWETGNGIPDTNSLTKLCEVLDVSINELLSGERLSNEDYKRKAEAELIQQQKDKEESVKRLLLSEIFLGSITTISFLIMYLAGICLVEKLGHNALGYTLIAVSFVILLVGLAFCLYIEQKAGFYACKKCGHKHVPSFSKVLWAPHINRTRYMKCPHCNEHAWHKKVIK